MPPEVVVAVERVLLGTALGVMVTAPSKSSETGQKYLAFFIEDVSNITKYVELSAYSLAAYDPDDTSEKEYRQILWPAFRKAIADAA